MGTKEQPAGVGSLILPCRPLKLKICLPASPSQELDKGMNNATPGKNLTLQSPCGWLMSVSLTLIRQRSHVRRNSQRITVLLEDSRTESVRPPCVLVLFSLPGKHWSGLHLNSTFILLRGICLRHLFPLRLFGGTEDLNPEFAEQADHHWATLLAPEDVTQHSKMLKQLMLTLNNFLCICICAYTYFTIYIVCINIFYFMQI